MNRELDIVEAVVQDGDRATPYLRSGRGRRAVLAVAGDPAERLRLLRLFRASARVFAPVPPPELADAASPEAFGRWVRGIVDGLGLLLPILVLAHPYADAAGALASELADCCGGLGTAGRRAPRMP